MAKEIVYDANARLKLLEGINAVANAVKVTIGPKGRNAVIGGKGAPAIINDGVSIAKEIELDDEIQQLGVELIQSVASKTNDVAGDGTSGSCVLTQAIVTEGIKVISAGYNPMEIRQGIYQAVDEVRAQLKELSREVSTKEEVAQVATISAGNNEEIGNLIADAMEKVGHEGIITVAESRTNETILKVVDGMQFDRGYISPYFINNQERGTVELDDPYILLVGKTISSMSELVPILEQVAKAQKPVVIIAENVEGEALSTIIVNTMRKVLRAVAIPAPEYGEQRVNTMKDIAILTGGNYIDTNAGFKLEDITLNNLGKAKKVTVTKDHTVIVVEETNEELTTQVNTLKNKLALKTYSNDYEKQHLQERLARLSGGVAVIAVGAGSEVEMKEKKLRIEDALNATRAAVTEGVVPGGGTALAHITAKLNTKKFISDDVKVGYEIVKKSLEAPLIQIANNAGVKGDVVAEKVMSNRSMTYGYDALKGKYTDMINAGIIDPAKVIRSALENAANISASLLTTEVAIVPKKEQQQGITLAPQMMPM